MNILRGIGALLLGLLLGMCIGLVVIAGLLSMIRRADAHEVVVSDQVDRILYPYYIRHPYMPRNPALDDIDFLFGHNEYTRIIHDELHPREDRCVDTNNYLKALKAYTDAHVTEKHPYTEAYESINRSWCRD